MQTSLLTSFFVIMVISLELATEEGGGEAGGRSREGRRRKKRGRRMKSWMREEGGHPLVCVAKRSLCLLLTHGTVTPTICPIALANQNGPRHGNCTLWPMTVQNKVFSGDFLVFLHFHKD